MTNVVRGAEDKPGGCEPSARGSARFPRQTGDAAHGQRIAVLRSSVNVFGLSRSAACERSRRQRTRLAQAVGKRDRITRAASRTATNIAPRAARKRWPCTVRRDAWQGGRARPRGAAPAQRAARASADAALDDAAIPTAVQLPRRWCCGRRSAHAARRSIKLIGEVAERGAGFSNAGGSAKRGRLLVFMMISRSAVLAL